LSGRQPVVDTRAPLLSILALVERFANERQQKRVKEIEILCVS